MLLNIKPINSAKLNIENPDGIKTKMNLVLVIKFSLSCRITTNSQPSDIPNYMTN